MAQSTVQGPIGGEKIDGAVELSDKSEFQVGTTTLMLIVTEDH